MFVCGGGSCWEGKKIGKVLTSIVFTGARRTIFFLMGHGTRNWMMGSENLTSAGGPLENAIGMYKILF